MFQFPSSCAGGSKTTDGANQAVRTSSGAKGVVVLITVRTVVEVVVTFFINVTNVFAMFEGHKTRLISTTVLPKSAGKGIND